MNGALFGTAWLLLGALTVLVVSPALVAAAARTQLRRTPTGSPAVRVLREEGSPMCDQLLAVPPDLLSTRELCLAWRISYWALQCRPEGPAREEIVHTRACYLDELERRDGDGFSQWLADGARAAGDPSRYLVTGP